MTDEDYRELIESAHLVRQMQQHPGWDVLAGIFFDRMGARNHWLLSGHAKTIEEYRSAAGWVQGAKEVLLLGDRLDEQVAAERKRREEMIPAA